MTTELKTVFDLLREYGVPGVEYRPKVDYLSELVWIPTGVFDQLEIEWFDREDVVDIPASYVVTGRAYSPDHGMAGEIPIGSVYQADAVVALVKWALATVEPEDG